MDAIITSKRPLPCTCPNCGFYGRPNRRTSLIVGGKDVRRHPEKYFNVFYICRNCGHNWYPFPLNKGDAQ